MRVFPFPLAAAERTGVKRVLLPSQDARERCVPLFWCPDGERFWAMGSDNHGFGKIVVVRLDGTIKRLTTDEHHLLHREAVATQGGGIEGGLVVECPPAPAVLVQGRELAVVMSFPKWQREHICVSYYSPEKLEREKVIVGWKEPYPESLKPLGKCTLLAIVPDGRRLVLQQGRFAPHGAKEQVWVWDMDSGALSQVAKVGWVEQIYGWIGEEGMVVEMKGDPRREGQPATFEYGVLRIPKR